SRGAAAGFSGRWVRTAELRLTLVHRRPLRRRSRDTRADAALSRSRQVLVRVRIHPQPLRLARRRRRLHCGPVAYAALVLVLSARASADADAVQRADRLGVDELAFLLAPVRERGALLRLQRGGRARVRRGSKGTRSGHQVQSDLRSAALTAARAARIARRVRASQWPSPAGGRASCSTSILLHFGSAPSRRSNRTLKVIGSSVASAREGP